MNYYKHTILMVGIAAVFLMGCFPSSTLERYNRKETGKVVRDSTIRFTSEGAKEKNFTEEIPEDSPMDDFPEENAIDISSVMQKLSTEKSSGSANDYYNTVRDKLLMEIIEYLNTPYKYGGITKSGIDCSAFVLTVFKNTFNINLNRTARDQYQQGIEIPTREELKFGDLVFFDTQRGVRPGHVGIYIGDGLFAHSSSRYGVIVSSFDTDYYVIHYMGGRRIETVLNSRL